MNPVHALPAAGLLPVVSIAGKLGILDDLQAGLDIDGIVGKRGLDRRATTLLVDALCALNLCERDGSSIRWLRSFHHGYPWTELERFLIDGRLPQTLDDGEVRPKIYAEAVVELSEQAHTLAAAAAAALPRRRHVVDVGAGAGAWSLAMAERDSATRITAIDSAPVLERFAERARERGLLERAELVEGDYFEVSPTRPYDRVVLANVLHLERPADASRLLSRFARGLEPGGDVVIVDCIGDLEADTYRRFRAFYALHLGMRTRQGGVHAEPELRRWCSEAGLAHVRKVALDGGGGLALLVGSREQ